MISLVFTALVILVLVALLAFLVFGFGANFNVSACFLISRICAFSM